MLEEVLLMDCVNDDTCSEEEKRLEEGVRHEMEHGRRPRAEAEREEHITDLADGGVGQHTLHVALRECAECREQHGCRSDNGDCELNLRG